MTRYQFDAERVSYVKAFLHGPVTLSQQACMQDSPRTSTCSGRSIKPIARLTRDPAPLASNEAPRYPAQALRSGVEGSVNVRIELDANGVPTDVQVVERSGERSRDLDRAVVEAARKWRFEPAMKDGKPVAGAVVLPVDFKRQ